LVELCDTAFREDSASYFRAIGPGDHLLGWKGEALVTHLMWVERVLILDDRTPLRTAYIEQVATAPTHQRQGYATQLLGMLQPLLRDFDLAALSPATDGIYLRSGWQYWEGPLSHRRQGCLVPDPEERIMVLSLPRTSPDLNRHAPLSIEWRPGDIW
jgi:predicted acetyltransferase